MGVRQTADFLEKATWSMAVALLVLSLSATMAIPKYNAASGQFDTELRDQIEQTAPVDFQAPPMQEEIEE
jgi:preprotein translocase subunit SecG